MGKRDSDYDVLRIRIFALNASGGIKNRVIFQTIKKSPFFYPMNPARE